MKTRDAARERGERTGRDERAEAPPATAREGDEKLRAAGMEDEIAREFYVRLSDNLRSLVNWAREVEGRQPARVIAEALHFGLHAVVNGRAHDARLPRVEEAYQDREDAASPETLVGTRTEGDAK